MFAIDYKCGLPIFEQIYRSVITLGAAGAFAASCRRSGPWQRNWA